MSVRSFVPVLRKLERGLASPAPAQLRILRELEFDLEELQGRFRADGLSAEEARRRAIEALVPDRQALESLDRLHMPWYRRATRRVSPEKLKLAERGALAVATATVLIGQTLALMRADLLESPSLFMWPVLVLGGVLFSVVLAKSFQLWVKGDHRRPGGGVQGILGLSATVFVTGVGGVLIDTHQLAAALEINPELTGTLMSAWLMREAALLSVAIVIALAGGLAWLVLSQWVALLSGARSELLDLRVTSRIKED